MMEGHMTAPVLKIDPAREPHIGEYAAMQPLSGTLRVDESTIVQGVVRARYIRGDEVSKAMIRK
jgi:hypothetical protein